MLQQTLSPEHQEVQEDREKEEETHAYVRLVADSIPASDVRLEEVRREQMSDRE